jgi:hypothetical protein
MNIHAKPTDTPNLPDVGAVTDPPDDLRDRPGAGRPKSLASAVEPLAVGRKQAAQLFSVGLATWDRWDASGQLGPLGIRKNGRKLWILAELREWAAAGMPCRKEWLARKAAQPNGRG